jgi:DNA mismatch repair protein MutS
MTIDGQTRRNLEILASSRFEGGTGSLLSVIDLTKTPMGGRLLKKWLGQPLLDIAHIKKRQEAVSRFYGASIIRQKAISIIKDITDIERIIYRIKSDVATPRDVITLRNSLEKLPELKECLEEIKIESLLSSELKDCDEVVHLVYQSIVDEPGATLDKGGVIKKGFAEELDKLRMISSDAKKYLADIEQNEREQTGVKSLKVRYNRVFGYYIEVSKSNLDRVPEHYIRKQTLTGAERFYTPELKEYESTILNAQDQIVELESTIFRQVTKQIADFGEQVIQSSVAIAEIDVFLSLAEVAVKNNYVKPELNESDTINIKEGRHPVVEKSIIENGFVSNDTYLSNEDTQVIILTGPNMSGKSTYLKQVALIVLLAQIGSYIPAASASIGIVDRIFTRIGAQEDLAAGQSTFMVEMVETANILNNATSKSLIILDEVGRGTSTYDGLSIAWAVVEFIHNQPRLRAKTLFATHYHELVELAQVLPHVKNYNVAVMEERGKVIFLHKIVPGGADKSYGIYVAKLAGLPISVVRRAQEVLSGLEQNQFMFQNNKSIEGEKDISQQLSFFNGHSRLVDEISKLDIDSMSPLEAITRLYELKQKAEDDTVG